MEYSLVFGNLFESIIRDGNVYIINYIIHNINYAKFLCIIKVRLQFFFPNQTLVL